MMKSCCFTGHRDLTKETEIALPESFIQKIEVLVTERFVHFYAGGARRFDFLAEQVVLKVREYNPWIRLILVLPYEGHDQMWKAEIRSDYQRLIEKMPMIFSIFRITPFAVVCKRGIAIWLATAMFAFPAWFTQKVEQNIQ